MTRLDDYRSALRAGFADVSGDELLRTLDERGEDFVPFIVDHGLGPLWHARTGRAGFRESRLSAEALYAAQDNVLREIDALLDRAGIDYAVFKGAGTRKLLYDNPAIRACHDIDLLVRPEARVQAAAALVDAGFNARPNPTTIGHELTLSRDRVDIDLHWGLLRQGRLRQDAVNAMLDRRRRIDRAWLLAPEDELFVLLVHPAVSKHLAAWGMGLHRVLDILAWLRTQSCDRDALHAELEEQGVRTAAWATLRWADLLAAPHSPRQLRNTLSALRPGRLREAWLDRWLEGNLSERLAGARGARLLGLSLFLHDRPRDALRAVLGRQRARRRQVDELAAFRELLGQ
jgi:hypothetical protein